MFVVLAWFSDGSPRPGALAAARSRYDEAVDRLVPQTYTRRDIGGDDWGITVLALDSSRYRWPVLASSGQLTAVSLGLPIGLEATDPVGLASRLLDGEDVHANVVPPFCLIALDDGSGQPGGGPRVSIQQDWLGMARLFTGESGGVTAFCSRPSLLAAFLDGTVRPDLDGWASYTVCGHFGADMSPIRGARLLSPGERITGRRREPGGWSLGSQARYAVDDLVRAGVDARGSGLDKALDLAAEGLIGTATGIYDRYDGEITLGLSGGKDSRLIAASFLTAGKLPVLATHDDLAAEGTTARELVRILGDRRGLHPEHRISPAGAPANVLRVGLAERVRRMQRRHDYQFPSTFTVRSIDSDRLPDQPRHASISGAGGELAVGYWYPAGAESDDDRAAGQAATLRNLASAVPPNVAAQAPRAREEERIIRLIDRGAGLGLVGMELVDYVYLIERVRRWYTSAYYVGMVTPFLAPSFVVASFALTPAQKRARTLHYGLLERFLPEWAQLPYVTGASGTSRATRVWDGDGIPVICDLLDTAGGEIAGLVRPEAVERAARRSANGVAGGADQKILQQFAWLAVASRTLEPRRVRRSTSAAYGRITRPEPPKGRPPAVVSAVAGRLRFVQRSRVGRRIWAAVRSRVTR